MWWFRGRGLGINSSYNRFCKRDFHFFSFILNLNLDMHYQLPLESLSPGGLVTKLKRAMGEYHINHLKRFGHWSGF